MAIPEQINPKGLEDYLDVMSRAIFQAGMRWSVIEAKWPAFRQAFLNFDVDKVARFTGTEIDRLSTDSRLIRSRNKVEAVVQNARMMLDLDREFGGFRNYLQAFPNYETLSADLKKKFKYMGELNVYYFLFRVQQPVPDFDLWIKTIPGNHPRMREMVQHAREQDRHKRAG